MVGRPTGQPKTGGRKKGTPNKATKKRRALTEKLVKGGDTPLEVILAMMREERNFDADLLAAAVAAALPGGIPALPARRRRKGCS